MVSVPTRTVVNQKTTSVTYVMIPEGRNRQNPPTLGQLRKFVEACEDLPDEASVSMEKGQLDEGGRHNYTFRIRIVEGS